MAGPSTIPAEHRSEPEQPADMGEPDNEGTAGDPGSGVPSSTTYRCPFKKKGKRCKEILVRDEHSIKTHLKEHKNAGELPKNVKPCLLCALFPEHAKAPGRRQKKKRGAEKESSLQSFVRHFFDIHFGGPVCPFVCRYCGDHLSRRDSLLRHEETCEQKTQSSGIAGEQGV